MIYFFFNKKKKKAIHNAGKHMEDHLVAAYSALLIGHMLINQETDKLIDIIEVKSKLKDGSFKFMTQIIRKFIVFMKIMVSFINFNSK